MEGLVADAFGNHQKESFGRGDNRCLEPLPGYRSRLYMPVMTTIERALPLRNLGMDGPRVSGIGLGCMYLSISGRPDENDGIRTLHAAIDGGVTLLDTANVYCIDDADIGHNERLIAKALRQRDRSRITVATKGGLRRPGGAWTVDAAPSSLRAACEKSLRALETDVIDVYQLHAPDPKVPLVDSVGAISKLRDEGKIKYVGLSNVSVKEVEIARRIVPIASVQNRWNPSYRAPERDGILEYCTNHGIAFLPYSPFGGASGAKTLHAHGTLASVAKKFECSPHRLVVAWMLAKSPIVIPIPGARRGENILDNIAAMTMSLSEDNMREIESSF